MDIKTRKAEYPELFETLSALYSRLIQPGFSNPG
jgi:hypothetical protein